MRSVSLVARMPGVMPTHLSVCFQSAGMIEACFEPLAGLVAAVARAALHGQFHASNGLGDQSRLLCRGHVELQILYNVQISIAV